MMKWIAGGTGLVALGVLGWMQIGPSDAEAANLFPYDDPEAVAAGEVLYAEYCASCHAADLSGEPNWRSRDENGRLPAPPHDETGHTWHHPDIQLFMLTKYGPAELIGGGYESNMPGFDGVLTDAEILHVMAYIKSTWPPEIVERHDAMNSAVAEQQN